MSTKSMSAATDSPATVVESLALRVQLQLQALPGAGQILNGWPVLKATRDIRTLTLPVCRWLPNLEKLAIAPTVGLVKEFIAAAPAIDWRQTYSAEDLGLEFLENYGWSELVGLRGPIPSESIACGFLMLGPETEYPAH